MRKTKYTLRSQSQHNRSRWHVANLLLDIYLGNNYLTRTAIAADYRDIHAALIANNNSVDRSIGILERITSLLRAAQEAHNQATK